MTSDPRADVAFLARSDHRVNVLRTLGAGPRSRPALHEETGVPQPTLGRILGDFEERNWVERRDREYALTEPGGLVATAFEALLDTVETTQRLGTVVEALGAEALPFDVERLADATVTTPEPGDVLRHARRGEELIAGASEVRILTNTMMPDALEIVHERVVDPGSEPLRIESVIAGDAIDHALAVPSLAECVRGLVTSGRSPVYRYDEPFRTTLALVDGRALLAPTDDRGMPVALVESDDETVRAWVEERFERARSRATLLTGDDL